jgi:hypothetical protein
MTMPKDPARRAATIERMRQAALRRPPSATGARSPSYRGGGTDKNGQRSDNRPENLELWSTRNPKGQRISDKIEWAVSFLLEYGVIANRPQSESAWVSGLLSI